MKKKYIIKNLSFVEVEKEVWWTKYGADFEINKNEEKFLIYDQGFLQGIRFTLQSSKRYCRKLHLKNIKKYLQEVESI